MASETNGQTLRFPHNPKFDEHFAAISKITWYPYVGNEFGRNSRRVMVFGHNMPVLDSDKEGPAKIDSWKARTTFTSEWMEEWAYVQKPYTKSFRAFIKGSVGLADFNMKSSADITSKVDAFVREIAYANFIQGVVRTATVCTTATDTMVQQSKLINRKILDILDLTHCICWGSHVFNYITTLDGVEMRDLKPFSRKGFAYAALRDGCGRQMHVLKVYHPCMPGFYGNLQGTHEIIRDFLSLPPLNR